MMRNSGPPTGDGTAPTLAVDCVTTPAAGAFNMIVETDGFAEAAELAADVGSGSGLIARASTCPVFT